MATSTEGGSKKEVLQDFLEFEKKIYRQTRNAAAI